MSRKLKSFKSCSLREVLLEVVQHVLAVPVDLLVVLGKRVLRVKWPGHHILLNSRSHHLASAAWSAAASSLCGSEIINHIRLGWRLLSRLRASLIKEH